MTEKTHWWEWEMTPKAQSWSGTLRSVIAYRHLLSSLVRREFILNYQQTILGPFWILVQPILTLLTYLFVFGRVFKVPISKDVPPILFFFSGIILWNFFNDVFNNTSRTFRDNVNLFSKVYFPRIIVPLSIVGTQFFRFLIQFFLLLILLFYFVFFKGFSLKFEALVIYLPLTIISVGLLSLSMGLIFSIMTAKYRDLIGLIDICIRLLIFVTPVFYPMASVKPEIQWVVSLNPLAPLFELFRLGIIGNGSVTFLQLIYSAGFVTLSFIIALTLFNRRASKVIEVV